jgi:hypothetical protein
MPTFDPITSPTTRIAPHREAAFVFPEQTEAARAKNVEEVTIVSCTRSRRRACA